MTSIEREIYERARPISFQEFAACFSTFQTSAFRLELLPQYQVIEEQADYARFLEDQRPPADLDRGWSQFISACVRGGKSFHRVRLEPHPLTSYYRYEVLWSYRRHQAAGEDIRILDEEHLRLATGNLPFLMDYWLFDRSTVICMVYDMLGRFLGGIRLDPADGEPFMHAADHLISVSTPIDARYFGRIEGAQGS